MASFNSLTLLGNLTRDPELKYTPGNTAFTKCGIAVNEKWKDKDGNAKESVTFIDFTLFGKQAEAFNQHMAKGRQVLLNGRLRLDQWTTDDGQKRSKHVMMVDRFVFVGPKPDDGQREDPAGTAPADEDSPF